MGVKDAKLNRSGGGLALVGDIQFTILYRTNEIKDQS
jgi:hypothetical protein